MEIRDLQEVIYVNTITEADWIKKLKEQEEYTLRPNVEGELEEVLYIPNKIILEPGKKPIVSAFYNGRWYSWELIN